MNVRLVVRDKLVLLSEQECRTLVSNCAARCLVRFPAKRAAAQSAAAYDAYQRDYFRRKQQESRARRRAQLAAASN